MRGTVIRPTFRCVELSYDLGSGAWNCHKTYVPVRGAVIRPCSGAWSCHKTYVPVRGAAIRPTFRCVELSHDLGSGALSCHKTYVPVRGAAIRPMFRCVEEP